MNAPSAKFFIDDMSRFSASKITVYALSVEQKLSCRVILLFCEFGRYKSGY